MKNKFFCLFCLAIIALPGIASSINEQIDAEIKKYLNSQNLPLPDDGIKIVDSSDITNPNIKQYLYKKRVMFSKQGYIKEDNPRAKELLEFPLVAKQQLKNKPLIVGKDYTGLVEKLDEISLKFEYPQIDSKVVYGYAPTGSLGQEEWTGFVGFFEKEDLGQCALTVKNIKVSHGSVKIPREVVRYDINAKITTIDVNGNQSGGFVYTVSWFDKVYFRDLECANKLYSSELLAKTIELAKHLDSLSF